MKGSLLRWCKYGWLLVFSGAILTLAAQDKNNAASSSETDAVALFCKFLPQGQKNLNVKIPNFKDGKLASLVTAGTMARVDDDRIEMESMEILIKGETDAKDTNVKLRTATYQLSTSTLSSDQRSIVTRSDFQIEGDSLVFDTRTQQGKMAGHVEMVIYETGDMKEKSQDKTKSGDSNQRSNPQKKETK